MACTSVQVAVRVRPLVPHEIQRGCKEIVETISENQQVVIKNCDKAFTFNHVLGVEAPQEELYERCVAPLMKNIYEGFNVTIFAYGQTGSGKTHSMGTSYNGKGSMGVIPRAVRDLFDHVQDNFNVDFSVNVSFIELYREVLYDLLANKPRDQCTLEIREDVTKGIHIPNVTEIVVNTAEEVLSLLAKGSLGRATASTNMNEQSSRSHSIFTVSMNMVHKTDKNLSKTSKFHMVDLAGSERSKKTGAEGKTFKEGVDINKGLFVLGNVISALGDEKTQNGYISYRDSNLTRLLKDSLGGNSVTLMIACISPADYNLEETISTLRYADRARKIKNKPIVNQDPKTAEINELKRQLKLYQMQIAGQGDLLISSADIDRLRAENSSLELKIKKLSVELSVVLLDKTGLHEKLLILQSANEVLSNKLLELKQECNVTFGQISLGVENQDIQSVKENLIKLQQIQGRFEVLQDDQKKTEGEIRSHEETFSVLVHTARSSVEVAPREIQEKQDVHTDRQLALHTELQEVSKQLALKEQLAKQLAINTNYMIDHQVMMETEKKIDTLEKEKGELLQQLHNVKSQENSNKIAEQRRKRVQELEEQLKDLKKRNMEQSKMLKIKERNELKMKQLNNDIVSMKTAKVKLLKQMRQENDRFRTWKQEAERELARIKHQDRKKQTEISKMKMVHEKQKNFLKRKFEEAAALNKRLQNTLMKRKAAQSTRFTGKVEKISAWLKEEMEVFVNVSEAEVTLAGLLEDRATLQQQLDELKNNPESANNSAVKSIEEDLELRSVQIQDLQQKLLDSDEENKAKSRFDAIQTMVEAKYSLRALFEQAAEYNRKEVQAKRELSELAYSHKELSEKLELAERECRRMEDSFAEQIASLEKAHHENMGTVLKQIIGVKNESDDPESELSTRCQILSQQIGSQDRIIENLTAENKQLQQRIKDIEEMAKSSKKLEEEERDSKRTNRSKNLTTVDTFVDEENFLEISKDDVENDPDWRKTPLARRIMMMTKKRNKGHKSISDNSNETQVERGSKRSLEGGCTCKSCNTKKCKCKKSRNSCGPSCKCLESVCQNRTDLKNEFSGSSSPEFDDLKKPRIGRHLFDDLSPGGSQPETK